MDNKTCTELLDYIRNRSKRGPPLLSKPGYVSTRCIEIPEESLNYLENNKLVEILIFKDGHKRIRLTEKGKEKVVY